VKFYPHVTDQIAHFIVAMLLLSLFAFGGVLGAAAAGLGMGLIRELSEAGGSRIAWHEIRAHFAKGSDPWIDLAFWTLGGLAAGSFRHFLGVDS
jgi:hypothetical protein